MLRKGIVFALFLFVLSFTACGNKQAQETIATSKEEISSESFPKTLIEATESAAKETTESAVKETVETTVKETTESAVKETVETTVNESTESDKETVVPPELAVEETVEATEKDTAESNAENEESIKENVFEEDFFVGSESTETKPSESELTKPTETVPVEPVSEYESFLNMSPAEQQAYMMSFDNVEVFFNWYNAEKEKYDAEHPPIEIDGGVIDLDKIING